MLSYFHDGLAPSLLWCGSAGLFSHVSQHTSWRIDNGLFSGGVFLIFIVGIFAFISGYGFSCSYGEKPFSSVFIHSIKKAIEFLLFYWIILFVFFFPFFVSYEVLVANAFDWQLFFESLIGADYFIDPFSWYVWFYLLVLFFFPFYSRLLKRNVFVSLAFSFFPLGIVAILQFVFHYGGVSEYLSVFSCLCLGFCFGKFHLGSIALSLFKGKKWLLSLCSFLQVILCSLVVFKWSTLVLFLLKPFAVVLFILFVLPLLPAKFTYKFGEAINSVASWSMNIWLLHGLTFSTPVLAFLDLLKFFYSPRITIVIFALVFLVFCLISWGFSFIDKFIISFSDKLFLLFNKKENERSS